MLPDLRIPSVDLNSLKMRIKDPSIQHLDSVLLTDINQLGVDPIKSSIREDEPDRRSIISKKAGRGLLIDNSSKMLEADTSEVNIGERSSVRMSAIPTEIKLKKFVNL